MSMLERDVAPSAALASSRAVPTSPPAIDRRLLLPLQRTGCGCGGSCGACGPPDDQGRDVPTVMRLAAAQPAPATALRKPPAGLLQLQAKAGNRAVTRLVSPDAARGRSRSPSATVTTTATTAGGAGATATVEPSPAVDAEAPLKQGPDELAASAPAPPPAGGSPPPPGAERETTVARIEPTVQRDDEDGGVLGIITGRASSIVESVRSRGRQLWAAIETMIAGLVQTVAGLAEGVLDRLGRALGALRQHAESLWARLRDRLAAVGERLQSGFDALRGRLRTMWEQIKQTASGLLETLRTGGAALIERIRGQVLAALGPTPSPGGACTTSAAIDRAHVSLPGDVDASIAEFVAQATAGLAGLDGDGAAGEAQGRAGGAALEATSAADVATADADGSAANAALDQGAASLRGDAEAGLGDVQAEADASVTRGERRVADDASGLDEEGRSSVGGLGGLISGLASAVLGQARRLIAGARDRVGGVVAALRRQAGAGLGRLGQQLRTVLQRVRSAVERVIDRAIAVVREVVTRIGAAIAGLRAAIERITGLLRRLAQSAARLWSELRSRVAAGWSRLRGALGALRGRAAALLPPSDCTPCELRDAAGRADRLATTGLRGLDLGALVAGLTVALKRAGGSTGTTLPPEVVVARLGRGQPLAGDVRGRMEAGFGRSFDGVEVHTGDPAGRLADEMGARAFTVGRHVGFGPAQYRPGTVIGDALLAHELAHVADVPAEHDADETAVAVTARLWSGRTEGPVPLTTAIRSGLAVRRCPKCCEIKPPTGDLKLVEAVHDGKPMLQPFDDAQESKRQNQKEGERDDRYSMGLTGLNMNAVKDAAAISATPNRKCDELCDVNTDRLPTFSLSPFYAVKAGSYDRGTVTFPRATKENVPAACRGKQMKKSFRITQATSDQAAAAEVEHCNDLKLGWKRSVAKYLGAVQELGSGFCTPEGKKCEAQFKELVKARSGIETPIHFMNCAQTVSLGRDEPDNHIFRAPRVVEVTADCSEAIYEFPPLTKLGQQSSEELIDACGT